MVRGPDHERLLLRPFALSFVEGFLEIDANQVLQSTSLAATGFSNYNTSGKAVD
jgi:hypothetical protein